MLFKETAHSDLNKIFFDDFGEKHIINGQEITVIVDNDRLEYLKISQCLIQGNILLLAKKTDFKVQLKPREAIVYDLKRYEVEAIKEDMGLLEIVLSGKGVY